MPRRWSTEAVGANISAAGTTAGGGNLTETDGRWVQVEMYGRTEADQDSLGVQVRLGFYGSLATGLALFDDVRLDELPGPPTGVPPEQIVNLGAVEKQASIVAAEQPVAVRPRPLNPWLVAALLAALAAGVLALLGLQLGGRLRARLRRWKLRPKVTILDLVYGPGTPGGRSAGGDAESSRRGRRSREGLRVEHRRCPRAPFAAEVTVRRIHPNGRLETLRLRAGNVSDGGLFLLCADPAALRLDEEVSLELAGADLPVDLGRAVVVRVHWLSGRVCGGFGLRFLWPPWRIHRLRQGLPASLSRLPAPRARRALPAPTAE